MRLLIEILILLSSLKCLSTVEISTLPSAPVVIDDSPLQPRLSFLKPISLRKSLDVRSERKSATYKRLDQIKDHEHSRIHCHELVTPFLLGYRLITDNNLPMITDVDPSFRRLMQLLQLDMKDRESEDINSVLYQISNLKIKLYLWDVKPVQIFLTEMTGEARSHSFMSLKKGIKTLFSEWRLNISDTAELLKRARMFRPPCVVSKLPQGSTKPPRGSTMTPLLSTTLKDCDENDTDEDCNPPECENGDYDCVQALRMISMPIKQEDAGLN